MCVSLQKVKNICKNSFSTLRDLKNLSVIYLVGDVVKPVLCEYAMLHPAGTASFLHFSEPSLVDIGKSTWFLLNNWLWKERVAKTKRYVFLPVAVEPHEVMMLSSVVSMTVFCVLLFVLHVNFVWLSPVPVHACVSDYSLGWVIGH